MVTQLTRTCELKGEGPSDARLGRAGGNAALDVLDVGVKWFRGWGEFILHVCVPSVTTNCRFALSTSRWLVDR